jgi:hypothetical protein
MTTKQLREMERQATVVAKREIVITFQDVRNYIHQHAKHYVDDIIDVVQPFAMDYIKHPYGFAETDKLNDIDECIKEIDELFISFTLANQREYNRMVNETIEVEFKRWKDRNAWAYGRYIGRLAYLLNQSKK